MQEVDKAKQSIIPFDVPKAKMEGSKVDQLKAALSSQVSELALVLRGIQKGLETADTSKDIVPLVQHVKNLKQVLDTFN